MEFTERLEVGDRRRRQLEALALGSTVAAFALTLIMVRSARAVESNPVAAVLLGELGWLGAGLLAIALEGALLAGWARLADRYPRASTAVIGAVATAGSLDVTWNLYVLSRSGLPPGFPPGYEVTIGGCAGLAFVILTRRRWMPVARPMLRRQRGRVEAVSRQLTVADIVGLGLVILLLTSPAASHAIAVTEPSNVDWNVFAGEESSSESQAFNGTLSTKEWSKTENDFPNDAGLDLNGNVYIAQDDGDLVSRNFSDGSLNYETNIAATLQVVSGDVTDDDILLAGDFAVNAHAIHASNGSVEWSTPLSGASAAIASTLSHNGTHGYVGTFGDATIRKLRMDNGNIVASNTFADTPRGVAASENHVYVALDNGSVLELDEGDLSVNRTLYTTKSQSVGDLEYFGGHLYGTSEGSTSFAYKLDVSDGSEVWNRSSSTFSYRDVELSPSGESVYIGAHTGSEVFRLNVSDGSVVNQANTVDSVSALAAPSGGGDTKAVSGHVLNQSQSGIEGATVEAINSSSGSVFDSTTTDATGHYSVNVENNTGYEIKASKAGYENESRLISTTSDVSGFNITITASAAPYVSAADPRGNVYVNSSDRSVDLNATVADDNGDSIDATIYLNRLDGAGWVEVANDTGLSTGEEVNATVQVAAGKNLWRVETTDGALTQNSSDYAFRVGGTVNVFNGSDLSRLNNRTVTLNLTSTESGFSSDRSVSDGSFNLTGVPDETLLARVNATDFRATTLILDDVTGDYYALLYPESGSGLPGAGDTYGQCFTLDDQTGDFPAGSSTISAFTQYDGAYRLVASDTFGASNEANLALSDGVTYRLQVSNGAGDVKSLGSFVGDSSNSACAEVTIESTGVDGDDSASGSDVVRGDLSNTSYEWDAYRTDISGTPSAKFEFDINDNDTQTDTFRLKIYEHQNDSNEILNQSYGVVNSVEHTEPLTSSQANKTWVVEWNATLDGSEIGGSRVLGAKQVDLGVPIDDKWKGWISLIVLTLTAGLFGGIRAKEGAIVVPIFALVLWFVDWLPAEIGVMALLAALTVGVAATLGAGAKDFT